MSDLKYAALMQKIDEKKGDVNNLIRANRKLIEKIQQLQEQNKKLRKLCMTTMGCGYTWDEHMGEQEHDEKCEVCKTLAELDKE